MPIRKRITSKPERQNPFRTGKGRHPLLKLGSPHLNVWDLLCHYDAKGLTSSQLKGKTTFYHPQVIKDLLDHKLIAKMPNKRGGEFVYVADKKGRGINVQEVTVEVELLEDEKGRFHAKAHVVGSNQIPHGGVRTLRKRKMHFTIPLESELEDGRFTKVARDAEPEVIDGLAREVIKDPSRMIIEQ